MNRYFLLTLLLLLPMRMYSQSGWNEQISGVTSTLYDVAFTSIDRGYAVGDTGTALRTTNGGQTWERMEMPSPVDTTAVFNRVVFTSELVGYIVGSDNGIHPGFDYGRPIILRTSNGGVTWDASIIEVEGTYEDIQFVTSEIGYVVGMEKFAGAIFAKTTDGGESWNPLVIEKGYSDHNLFVEFRDTSVGLMSYRYQSGSQQVYGVLQTGDGGLHWEFSTLESESSSYGDIQYVEGKTWLVAYGGVYRTEDDGRTWNRIYSSGGWKFGFFNERVGYVVSGRESFNRMSKTIDGGMTWIQQDVSSAQSDLFGITSPALNVAYAVGRNGVILKTIDGGGTPVGVERSPRDDDRLTINPVPSAGHVRCGYRSDEGARQLEVVDLLGRVVQTQSIAGGSMQTVIDTEGMASGIYYCRLGSQTGVMVVAR